MLGRSFERKAPYYEQYNYIGQKGGLTKVRVFTGTDRAGHANWDDVCDCVDDQTAKLTVERLNAAVALKAENARLRGLLRECEKYARFCAGLGYKSGHAEASRVVGLIEEALKGGA